MKYQSNFWNNYFKYYDVLMEVIPYKELLKTISDKLNIKSGNRILDLGAGTGNIRHFLSNDITYIGLDNSKEALDRLTTKFPNSNVILTSIKEKLPFKDGEFDRVVSNNVLYTLNEKDWDFVISELKRVTKNGAIIVISNVSIDFKPVNIYKDHIYKILSKNFIKGSVQLLRLVYPTIQMFKYNRTIMNNQENGNYSFVNRDKQKEIFSKYGFKPIHKTLSVYANQAVLNTFVRE